MFPMYGARLPPSLKKKSNIHILLSAVLILFLQASLTFLYNVLRKTKRTTLALLAPGCL